MRFSNKIFIIILLICPALVNAQARPATCDVRPHWVDSRVRSANLGSIGTFLTDGRQGKTIRSFNYKVENLVITVGINYVFEYLPKAKTVPYQIKLAITVSDKEEKDIFESPNSSEASTLYQKKWNLSASKNVNVRDLTYIFTISCKDRYKLIKK